jgi:hypothetical protein
MTYACGQRRQKLSARPRAAASAAGNPCRRCGACSFHCTCPRGFVTCECRRVDVDVDDARFCPIHGGEGCTNV